MSGPDADLMADLLDLNPGDDVTITVVHDSEELELDGYVVDAFHEESERAGYGHVPGSLELDVELANSAVSRLQDFEGEWFPTASHNVDITARETAPDSWSSLSVVLYTPEVDDGMVISDEWTDLGDLQSVELTE